MKDHVSHANHNTKVCSYLSKKEIFSDWIITTAFYAALHYTRAIMLPCEHDGHVITDFEVYYSKCKDLGEGRHGFQKKYVLINFPEISNAYSRLHDLSVTARYTRFEFGRDTSLTAMSHMNLIKDFSLRKKNGVSP